MGSACPRRSAATLGGTPLASMTRGAGVPEAVGGKARQTDLRCHPTEQLRQVEAARIHGVTTVELGGLDGRTAGQARMPRDSKLARLVKPWATRRRTWSLLLVPSSRPLEMRPARGAWKA